MFNVIDLMKYMVHIYKLKEPDMTNVKKNVPLLNVPRHLRARMKEVVRW